MSLNKLPYEYDLLRTVRLCVQKVSAAERNKSNLFQMVAGFTDVAVNLSQDSRSIISMIYMYMYKTVYFNVLYRIICKKKQKKKHPNFILLAKKNIPGKNLIVKFCLLLERGIPGGMKTVYFNVLHVPRPCNMCTK